MANRLTRHVGAIGLLTVAGIALLAVLLWLNRSSNWIRDNGGLASWVQAIGSLLAIGAVSFSVLFERRLQVRHARRSVLASAQMATDLMGTVASRAFDESARFSEWWVPQWHVIDEVMASCPIHDIQSDAALKAFVTIRELYGRMRSWDETNEEGWPMEDGSMQSYVGTLCLNASEQLDILRTELSQERKRWKT